MNKPTDIIASLQKGLLVLESFDADTPRQSITDAAKRTGLDRATTRRCLLTLHHAGYADYDGKFFMLTPRALRLGMGALSALPLPQIVQPWLDQLAEQIGQSCSVSVLDGTEIVYVARAAQKRVMSIGLMPGSRLPAYCTSMGRILLAALPPERAREVLQASDRAPRTPHTITDLAALETCLNRIRTDGYAINDQEVELGLRSIAVPVLDAQGQVVAALNTGLAATHDQISALRNAYLQPLLNVQQAFRRKL